jgi:4-hydroxy-tetrahydrodipicolinate reductase
MGERVRVGLIGRDGRMGRAAAEWIREAPDLQWVAGIARGEDWSPLTEAEVVLELTEAGNGEAHGRRLLEMGLRPVIGTSGVSEAGVAALDSLARSSGLGGAVVPNFSAVVVLLEQLAVASSQLLPKTSIVEAHHVQKVDSPSGTAAHLASRMGTEPNAVRSVRMEGVTALHEVRLWGDSEQLLLRHESMGLESFHEGLLHSVRYAARADGVALGLEAVMREACKPHESV